jgi:hypothetical protein
MPRSHPTAKAPRGILPFGTVSHLPHGSLPSAASLILFRPRDLRLEPCQEFR